MPALVDLAALKEQYDRDGFVVLRRYLNAAEVKELTDKVTSCMTGFVYHASFKGIRKDLNKADTWFNTQLQEGGHVPLVAAMILDKPVPASAAFFDKPVGESIDISPHVDGLGKHDGATLWIALDAADRNSGCLHYLCGSHREAHSNDALAEVNEQTTGATCVEVEPGDAVLHNARCVHWSRASRIDRQRRAVSYFYWAKSTLGDHWPGKPRPMKPEEDSKLTEIDPAVAAEALKALDRPWAAHPSIAKMLADDPEKFMRGLREKDQDAFDFLLARM